MTTIAETEASRLLADLRARYMAEPYDPARDITLADIMAALGTDSEDVARRAANAEVRAERMTKRTLSTRNGKRCYYRRK
jgi:hypothetical protein